MERRGNQSSTVNQEPISSDAWEKLREGILNSGGRIIPIGILDDIDPNGSADTACQRNFEEAAALGRIITVFTEKSHGIREVQMFRIIRI